MAHFFQTVMRCIDNLTPQQALLLVAAVVVGGALCLRGFGSRAKY
jgi:hypothetical protein